jgi:tetratricopeptide (TPR) repeat protein
VLSDLPSSQISSLVERADGNPFFLEELLRSAVFGKLDVLPDTVVAMAQSRLDTQPPESRRALRAASVFGDTFWLSPLKMMLDQESAEPLESVLDQLVRDELIEPRGELKYRGEVAFAFRHVLVRDAAYAALTDRDRALAHRIAARWLEDQGEPDVAQIAWHAEKGGLIAQAVRGYVRAAEQALAGNDLQAVIQRCEQAASLGANGEELGYARYLACAAHKWRGEFADAERRGGEALTLLARGARWYTTAGELGIALGILGHRSRVVELAMLVIANEESGVTRTAQCVAAARLVPQLLFAGERVVGTRVLSWVEEAMSSDGDVDSVARAQLLLSRGIQTMFDGDAAACIVMMEASAASSEKAGDLRRACAARINVASAAFELGGYDVSAALLLNLLEPAESLGLATLISDVHQNLGLALARLGRFDEAIAHESIALAGYTSRGQPREAAVSRSYFAQILALSGQWVAAEHEARAAIESLSAVSPRRAYALAILSEIVLHERRAEEAHAASLEASGILEVLGGLDEGEALVRLSYAKSLYAVGRFDAARDAIIAARDRLDERASKISDPTWRRSFVELIGENVQTLQLAQAWGAGW